MPKPLDPDKRAAIEQAIRNSNGRSRNAIARDHGVAASTVTKIANQAGNADAFDRSQTRNATRARSVDLADARLRLQERWLGKANEALDRSERECLVYAFGGKENDYNQRVLDLPPAADYRSFVTAAAVATDKMLALAKHDTSDGSDGAKSMLGELAAGLAVAYEAIQREDAARAD